MAKIKTQKALSKFNQSGNQVVVLKASRDIGVQITTIGPDDLVNGPVYLKRCLFVCLKLNLYCFCFRSTKH